MIPDFDPDACRHALDAIEGSGVMPDVLATIGRLIENEVVRTNQFRVMVRVPWDIRFIVANAIVGRIGDRQVTPMTVYDPIDHPIYVASGIRIVSEIMEHPLQMARISARFSQPLIGFRSRNLNPAAHERNPP